MQFSDGTVWDVATLLAKTVTEVVTNHPPTLANPILDQAAAEDTLFNYLLGLNTFSDPDADDKLTYAANLTSGSPLPSWLSFNANTRTFSGAPAQGDVGTLDIRVTATDKGGLSASDAFVLVIANTNDAPTLAHALAVQSATEDLQFTLTLPADTFADEDPGDIRAYSASRADGSRLPGWLSFDRDSATLTGTPRNSDVGVLSLRVTATDSGRLSAFDDFNLTVENVNDAPMATDDAAQVSEDGVLSASGNVLGNDVDIDAGTVLHIAAPAFRFQDLFLQRSRPWRFPASRLFPPGDLRSAEFLMMIYHGVA